MGRKSAEFPMVLSFSEVSKVRVVPAEDQLSDR